MTVSVVIPTWNRPESLVRTLEALAVQTVPPLEVLIIAAGRIPSMNDIRGIVPGLRVRLIPSAVAHVCVQRNRGIREAEGSHVLLCDDDIEPPHDYLARLTAYAALHPEASAVTGVVVEPGGSAAPPGTRTPRWSRLVWNAVWRRSLWCDLRMVRIPRMLEAVLRPVLRAYERRGNTRTAAGWPLVTDVRGEVFRCAFYGLGAALVPRALLLEDPYDEGLDADGIGDNYGVALGLPGPLPVHVLPDCPVAHHRSREQRRSAAVTAARRMLALHSFLVRAPGHAKAESAWLLWSALGDVIESVLTLRWLRAVTVAVAAVRIACGTNPFLRRR